MVASEEEVKVVLNQMEFEESRRLHFKEVSKGGHETELVEINGAKVKIDVEILPLVKWMNSLSGVVTQFSCQGEVYPTEWEKPHIFFHCKEFATVENILKILERFRTENSVSENILCSYFTTDVKIECFQGEIRYILKWYDYLSMKDFTKWLGDLS